MKQFTKTGKWERIRLRVDMRYGLKSGITLNERWGREREGVKPRIVYKIGGIEREMERVLWTNLRMVDKIARTVISITFIASRQSQDTIQVGIKP